MKSSLSRRAEHKEDNRQKILERSIEVFLKNGYERTSMGDLARASGSARQTLYAHFQSKENLFINAIRHHFLSDKFKPQMPNFEVPVEEFLFNLGKSFLNLLLSNDAINLMRTCISEASNLTSLGELFVEAGPEYVIKDLTNYLDSKVEDGELAIPNTEHAATQFVFMINSTLPFRALFGAENKASQKQIDDYIQSCVTLFLKGYQA